MAFVIRTIVIGDLLSATFAHGAFDPRWTELITAPLGGPEIATSRASRDEFAFPLSPPAPNSSDRPQGTLFRARTRDSFYLRELSFRRDDGHGRAGRRLTPRTQRTQIPDHIFYRDTSDTSSSVVVRRPPLTRSGDIASREALRTFELVGHDVFD